MVHSLNSKASHGKEEENKYDEFQFLLETLYNSSQNEGIQFSEEHAAYVDLNLQFPQGIQSYTEFMEQIISSQPDTSILCTTEEENNDIHRDFARIYKLPTRNNESKSE
ncbi:hypothetical protein ACP70R_015058 [Stipagrostis hirtigluma subsp. patula]